MALKLFHVIHIEGSSRLVEFFNVLSVRKILHWSGNVAGSIVILESSYPEMMPNKIATPTTHCYWDAQLHWSKQKLPQIWFFKGYKIGSRKWPYNLFPKLLMQCMPGSTTPLCFFRFATLHPIIKCSFELHPGHDLNPVFRDILWGYLGGARGGAQWHGGGWGFFRDPVSYRHTLVRFRLTSFRKQAAEADSLVKCFILLVDILLQ